MFKTLMTTAALALLAGAAFAQAPAASPAPAPAASVDPTAEQVASWIAGRHGEVQGVDADTPQAPPRDGRIHGEFGASIGSGGYRSGYGVATMPIGQRGDVTVGVSDEHLGGGNRAYGPGGYGGGGYGGERRTLSIGVDLTGQGQGQRCNASDPGVRWGPPRPTLDDPCRIDAPALQPER